VDDICALVRDILLLVEALLDVELVMRLFLSTLDKTHQERLLRLPTYQFSFSSHL